MGAGLLSGRTKKSMGFLNGFADATVEETDGRVVNRYAVDSLSHAAV